jgi:hypothetical protein
MPPGLALPCKARPAANSRGWYATETIHPLHPPLLINYRIAKFAE